MTLPATESWNVRGADGPKYKVGPRCSNPGCQRLAEHAHHIVRRSQLSGDYAWIVLNERVLGNLTGLCPQCHDDVTGRVGGHKAAIRISDDRDFLWCDVVEMEGQIVYLPQGKLEPQPPTPETLAQRAPGHEHTESDTCPFCGQTRRRRSATPLLDRRRRKTWTVLVPDDEQERGAAVLDTLVDDLAPLLGVEPNRTGRYFVLVPTLAYAQLDRKRFLETIKGVGG
jgi:hypothetical protein